MLNFCAFERAILEITAEISEEKVIFFPLFKAGTAKQVVANSVGVHFYKVYSKVCS